MTSNPFRDRLAQLPTPAQRIDQPTISYSMRPSVVARIRTTHPEQFMITERQYSLICTLLDERDLNAEQRPKYQARLIELNIYRNCAQMTRTQASALIDTLLDLPKIQAVTPVIAPAAAEVPAGRYAYTGVDGATVFVKVDRPTEGRWAGRTFVELQLSDTFERMPRDGQRAALRAIETAGVRESALRYGRELGICSVCSRTLTNEGSRAAGIGPICAGRNGW